MLDNNIIWDKILLFVPYSYIDLILIIIHQYISVGGNLLFVSLLKVRNDKILHFFSLLLHLQCSRMVCFCHNDNYVIINSLISVDTFVYNKTSN